MNIAIIDDISTDAEDLKNIAVFYFEEKTDPGRNLSVFQRRRIF